MMKGGRGKEMDVYGIEGMDEGKEGKMGKRLKMIVLGGLVKMRGIV